MYIPDLEYKKIVESVPIVCVDVVIVYNQKCLLLRRDNEPAKGQYWFPGGRIYKMETIREAAIRKAKEETNLDCEFVKIISAEETIFMKNENMDTDVHTINICCYLTTVSINNLKFDMYHDDCKWIDQQSDSYHEVINHVLSLIGFKDIKKLEQNIKI